MPVPFPDPWADAWDSYEYTKLAEGQSPNSTRTRRSSVLRLAQAYPDRQPEKMTRRDIERHITAMRKRLKPATVFSAFHDLRSFFGWLAKDTRAANIMDGMKINTTGMADAISGQVAGYRGGTGIARPSVLDAMAVRRKALWSDLVVKARQTWLLQVAVTDDQLVIKGTSPASAAEPGR